MVETRSSAGKAEQRLPKGYTKFGETLASEEAASAAKDMLEESFKRNPDAHGMYVYNDFAGYGEVEVIENAILSVYEHVVEEQDYVAAFKQLEGMLLFLEQESNWVMIDDGVRFEKLVRVLGAAWVSVLSGLQEQNVDERTLPNLTSVAEHAVHLGQEFNSIGDRCSRYPETVEAMLGLSGGGDPPDVETGPGPDESFDFEETFNEYDAEYGVGGENYDITRWGPEERKRHSFEAMKEAGNSSGSDSELYSESED